ncbi:MAG: hypothetical protein AAF351_08620 [Pseudomonadota bacterium]
MLTLHPFDTLSRYNEGPYALLPDQLQHYLSAATQFPALRELAECDPYDGHQFSAAQAAELREELARFAQRVHRRDVPKPPEMVSNSPGEPADERYGWEGLELFCRQFDDVLSEGITSGAGIVSLGD